MKPGVLGGGRKFSFSTSFCISVKKLEMTLPDFWVQNNVRVYVILQKSIPNNEPL